MSAQAFDPDHVARVILTVAAETNAAEARLIDQIIEAAEAGNCQRVLSLARAWRDKPPVEVVESALQHASGSR